MIAMTINTVSLVWKFFFLFLSLLFYSNSDLLQTENMRAFFGVKESKATFP